MDIDEVMQLHERHTGVLEMTPELAVKNKADLGKAYTPGVADVSKAIQKDPRLKNKLTLSGKLVAVVTDGSAVLGLGNIGPGGGLPVVEGKALLYKDLANVDAIPIAVNQVPVDEFVQTIENVSLSFAGIHLEDIGAPACFEIEQKLAQKLDIPVYHDDQEGTAIVVLAGLINAARVVDKKLEDLKVVINGVGAGGVATAKLLYHAGIHQLTLVDINGVVHSNSTEYNHYQTDLAKQINLNGQGDDLDDVINDQDVFIGLSDANVLKGSQVSRMAQNPIIFGLANPLPEIDPKEAQKAGASVIATGSSQYPNQVNNILVFPGLFKGLLESGLKKVDLNIEETVARALSRMIETPTAEHIIPGVFDTGVVDTVTKAIVSATALHQN